MKQNELEMLHRYLDGAITPEELETLEDLLRNSAEARATLRSLATIDAKWQQLAVDEAVAIPSDRVAAAGRSGRAIPMWLTLSAIAASLLVGALGWFRTPEERAVEIERGIARVIRIEGEGKAGQDRVVARGAELFAGEELAMQQGLIELAFRETGVHVVATAPLRMKLDSDQRVSLHEGQVKLVVPPQGVGFVVDTAQRKFVDLGTSFVVTANSEGSEVLVLDGQISVNEHAGAITHASRPCIAGAFSAGDEAG
jgi:ferric-dicitrate binding protein FerR (iron transport regulator)